MTTRDRDEMFLELTRSICPVCKRTIDAEVNARDDQVFLRKRCPEHGEFEARVYGDAEMYVAAQRFNKPGSRPLTTQTEVKDGCPQDCGLCPEHKQHACLGIIEVNTGCNLDCPICFADSGSPRANGPDGYEITLDQCAFMLDAFVAAEGEPEVVMFSGGEPTIHRDILAMIDLAQERPINAVNLNTNGIRLATDKRFAAEVGRRNRPGNRINVYLQFDGLEPETHLAIRGRDLRDLKQRALDNCAAVGLTVTLVAAVEKDVNEHEIGAVIRHGLADPAVRSVVFQPVTHSGRHVEFDPLTRLTNSDVLHAIGKQVQEWVTVDDFFPVPCCAPTCRSVTYLLTQGTPGDPDFGIVPIPRLLQVEDYLDYVANRVVPDYEIREALEKLWSASAFIGTDTNDDAAHQDRRSTGLRRRLRRQPARGTQHDHRQHLHDRGPGLPRPLHPQRASVDEVLRRGDHARRQADPVLRLQLRGLPRTGPRPDERGRGRRRRTRTPSSCNHSSRRPGTGASRYDDDCRRHGQVASTQRPSTQPLTQPR